MFAQKLGKSSLLKLFISADDPTAMVLGERSRLAHETVKSI